MVNSAVLVIFIKNKLLLTKRNRNLRNYPSQWSFVGGKLDGEESAISAAIRECYEELGVKVEPDSVKEFFPCPVFLLDGKFKVSVFITEILEMPDINLNLNEVEEWGCFDIHNTPPLKNLTKHIVNIIRREANDY